MIIFNTQGKEGSLVYNGKKKVENFLASEKGLKKIRKEIKKIKGSK